VDEAGRATVRACQNATVGRDAVADLARAAELEREDRMVAQELAVLSDLADRAGSVSARGADVRETLARIPEELDELDRRARLADTEHETARAELQLAEERLSALERGRRRRTDETERARREAATARQRLADAEADVVRLRERGEQLRRDDRELRDEARLLTHTAAGIAAELRQISRVPGDAGREPETLAAVEDWGQLVRSALLVARGGLETERERIVTEANVLGTSALGETLGASSVSLVRQRLERELP
jgi:chromosome segregation ATPase